MGDRLEKRVGEGSSPEDAMRDLDANLPFPRGHRSYNSFEVSDPKKLEDGHIVIARYTLQQGAHQKSQALSIGTGTSIGSIDYASMELERTL